MIFTILSDAADKGNLLLVDGGMCRFGVRKNGPVVIYEIIVLPEKRRFRIGRSMVKEVSRRNPGRKIVAKCPKQYESNAFWEGLKFRLASQDEKVNVWERKPYFDEPDLGDF